MLLNPYLNYIMNLNSVGFKLFLCGGKFLLDLELWEVIASNVLLIIFKPIKYVRPKNCLEVFQVFSLKF